MNHKWVLPLVVIAQFAATSLWFSGNAIYPILQLELGFNYEIAPKLTIAVQLGFIIGTLVYAIFMIPDRYAPSKVFFGSALSAAASNLVILFFQNYSTLFSSRLLIGFFLAGIYPVGMKIVKDWYPQGTGKSLGYLVGALVLGTSLPHFIKSQSLGVSWTFVIISTSVLAVIAGLIILLLVGDHPHRKQASAFSFKAFLSLFTNRMTNRASFGYFGHMWELYAFWAFVPLIITWFNEHNDLAINQSLWTFVIIGVGSVGCVVGGYLSRQLGSCRVSFFAMLFSGLCGVLSIFFFSFGPTLFLAIMLCWGFFVIMDSPQFSSVIADYAESRYLGSTLTIVNCIGFAITIGSIRMIEQLVQGDGNYFWVLAIGPILGLFPTGKVAFRKSFPQL